MRSLGVSRVYVLDDQDPSRCRWRRSSPSEAEHAGIAVAAHDSIVATRGSVFSGEVEKIDRSRAQAVFFAGGAGPGTVALWQALHRADPQLLLLGSSALAVPKRSPRRSARPARAPI